ncbi:hypothetical protein V6N13_023755 [Hibiscus sabdariffa]|uniref:PGG domain-containing protein n=1 Tax=Hibiscus sabdariffa TaxID=183260 RepID=A0ABR2PN19_9ROSI
MQDMETSVYEAAISGNVAAMDALLREDELILDRVSLTCFHETPLHIAIMRGHLHFAASLLFRRPRFSGEFDSLHCLPIHLAAIEGHAELVEQLLDINPSCCSVRDQDGRTPLHLAAMKERVDVMNVLIRRCPESIEEKLYRGETSLHLCVRFNQLEALILLVEASSEWNAAFVTVQDDAGNTILHLATFLKHLEIVRYLVSLSRIRSEINAVNRMGFTVLDLLEHFPKDFKSLEIENILMKAVANRVEGPSNEIVGARTQRLLPNADRMKSETKAMKSSWFVRLHQACNKYLKHQGNWIEEMQGSLMLVATLTATISFQVAFSPPGGVWQQHYHKETEPVCRRSQDAFRSSRCVRAPTISLLGPSTLLATAFIKMFSISRLLKSFGNCSNKSNTVNPIRFTALISDLIMSSQTRYLTICMHIVEFKQKSEDPHALISLKGFCES